MDDWTDFLFGLLVFFIIIYGPGIAPWWSGDEPDRIDLVEVSILLSSNQRGIEPIPAVVMVDQEQARTLLGTPGVWILMSEKEWKDSE